MGSLGIINILSLSMKSFGTGFFVSSDGNILTCKHVLEKAGYSKCGQLINYKYSDNLAVYKAKWIKSIEKEDLALLCTNEKTEYYISMCDLNVSGRMVDSYGFPNGSKKEIMASVRIDRTYDDEKYMQLGKANNVTFGFSGAPLIYGNVAVGIIHNVTKLDSNGRLAEIAFAISAKRVLQFLSKDVCKKEICIGYGSKAEKCTNYVASKSEGLCEECFSAQFIDAVKAVYQAQNYSIYPCDGFFVAALKYGISTYYDAIFTIVKFHEFISHEDLFPIIDLAKESKYSISQIIIVTNAMISEDGLTYAKKHNIIIKTKEELLRSLFDFEPYKEDLLKYVNSEQLSTHYIEIYGTNVIGEDEGIKAEDYYTVESDLVFDYFDEDNEASVHDDSKNIVQGDDSANSTGKMLLKEYVDVFLESEYKALLILGDYGSGKTSFCYIYALELLDKFIQGKYRFLPIMIKLRGYNKAIGVAQLLTDYFVNSLGISNFNFLSLKLLLKNINIVLIFDGFDEVAKKVDFDIKYDVLKEICSLAENNTKIIVTCRPNYFQNASEFKQIFQNSHFPYEPGDKPLIEFIENSIAELNLQQIKFYIESYQNELKNSNTSISEVLQIIANTHDLTDLAKRPFLLYMILNTLPQILEEEKGKNHSKINAYRLYLVYTDNWIKREDSKNKTLIKQEDKELFCKELAFELYISNSVSLSYKDFPPAIKKYFKDVERIEDIDYFTHDIQSCSFLTSDRTGEFKFIHKSFMEYFVADRVITKLSVSFEKNKKKDKLIKAINTILGRTYFSMEICFFINDMMNYLNSNIMNAVSVYFDNINNVAKSNLISILAKTGINMAEFLLNHKVFEDISHVDFSNSNFKESILKNISFDNIQFYSIRFEKVIFINCNFNRTIFEKSCLEQVEFYNCQFESSEWREVNLINCKFNLEYIYDYSELYRNHKGTKTLRESSDFDFDFDFEEVIDNCDFIRSLWRESTIMQCTFNDCSFAENVMRSMKIHCSTFNNVDFSGTNILGSVDFKDNILNDVMGVPYEF